MNLSGPVSRLVAGSLAAVALGGLLTLFVGLATPTNAPLVVPTVLVLGLLAGVVSALYLLGRGSAGRAETVYW